MAMPKAHLLLLLAMMALAVSPRFGTNSPWLLLADFSDFFHYAYVLII